MASARLGETQLREQVQQAWSEISGLLDHLIGSGRMLDRELLLDLARFLEASGPAVAAYERLVARAGGETVVDSPFTALRPVGHR